MATQYKLIVKEAVTAATSTIGLTAAAANTIVTSVTGTDTGGAANVEVLVKKAAGGIVELSYTAITTTSPTELLTAPVALEATDVLYVRTSRTGTNFIISYVEDTEAAAGQAIDVLSNVDTTGVADNDVLTYDLASGNWVAEASTGGGAVNDLDDVISLSPTQGDVLQWNSGISKWIESSQLATLWSNFRNGTAVNVYADITDASSGRLELTPTGANVKTGVTGMAVTEASPGNVEFVVATDASGNTAHTAVHIDGTTTANQTDFLLKAGTKLQMSNGSQYTWLKPSSGNTHPTTVNLPTGDGTIALTTDIATDSAVAANTAKVGITSSQASEITANTAKVSYTDASAVAANTAKVGITSGQASAITANTAKVGITTQQASDITTNNAKVGITSGQSSAITANTAKVSYTDAAVDTRIEAASITDLDDTPSSLIANNILQVNPSGNAVILAPKRAAYSSAEINADQNRLFEADLTPSSNAIVDFLNDEAATASGANAKNFLGWWDGTEVILEGMVDTGAQPVANSAVGEALWLGTSGALSASAPTTQNHYSRIVGYHVGTEQGGNALIYFKPSPDWVQID